VTRLAAPEETADAIVRLARDPELRHRMGAAGQQRVAANYRKSATVSSYLRALHERTMAGIGWRLERLIDSGFRASGVCHRCGRDGAAVG
jgi:hypothetical protein